MTTNFAQTLDSEFHRVSREEQIRMAELVDEVAELAKITPRQLYNYRSGKWSPPASLIPVLCGRFKSRALIDSLTRDLEAAQVEVPESYDLAHLLVSSARSAFSQYERYFDLFDGSVIDLDDVEQIKLRSSEVIQSILKLNAIAEASYQRRRHQERSAVNT